MTPLDVLVGVSVSDPGRAELERHGIIEAHVKHAFVELARQILAAGGSLAYGGHLEAEGYTATLLALLRTYSKRDRPASERVRQYLARPIWEKLTSEQRKDLATYTTWIKVPAVGEGNDRAAVAREYTAMRQRMTDEIDARIVLGGKVEGYSGRWPGIVEEAYVALAAGRPLYVAGGLGGAAARVAELLRGNWPEDLVDHPDLPGPSPDELRATFEGARLRNGLEDDENALLVGTADLDLMVALVLRGLRARPTGR
jgi:SLOG cluster2